MKKLSLTLLIVLVSLLVTTTNYAQQRTIYYLPVIIYKIKADPNKPDRYNISNYNQVLFIGPVKTITCTYKYNDGNGVIGEITKQFYNHIEAYHTNKLGTHHSVSHQSGYWRFDNPNDLVQARASLVNRYRKNHVFINDFVYHCR